MTGAVSKPTTQAIKAAQSKKMITMDDSSDSDSDEEMEMVGLEKNQIFFGVGEAKNELLLPKKQSVAKAKPAAKPTRGDFILHFVTLAQCNLLGVVSVAAAKAAAPKAVLKKKDSDSDSDEELVPKTLCDCFSNLLLLLIHIIS